MLSQAVMQAVGDQNPVILAAQAHGFESDLDFLREAARRKEVCDEVSTSLIGAYEETRGHTRPQIPYFAITDIETVFSSKKLADKAADARTARAQKPAAAKSKKQPPRRCMPPRR